MNLKLTTTVFSLLVAFSGMLKAESHEQDIFSKRGKMPYRSEVNDADINPDNWTIEIDFPKTQITHEPFEVTCMVTSDIEMNSGNANLVLNLAYEDGEYVGVTFTEPSLIKPNKPTPVVLSYTPTRAGNYKLYAKLFYYGSNGAVTKDSEVGYMTATANPLFGKTLTSASGKYRLMTAGNGECLYDLGNYILYCSKGNCFLGYDNGQFVLIDASLDNNNEIVVTDSQNIASILMESQSVTNTELPNYNISGFAIKINDQGYLSTSTDDAKNLVINEIFLDSYDNLWKWDGYGIYNIKQNYLCCDKDFSELTTGSYSNKRNFQPCVRIDSNGDDTNEVSVFQDCEHDGKTRYFNLQGIEVISPSRGIFIRYSSGRWDKVVIGK